MIYIETNGERVKLSNILVVLNLVMVNQCLGIGNVGDIQLAQIIKKQQMQQQHNNNNNDDDDDDEDEKENGLYNLEVGDDTELESCITGIIKFIGSTDFAKGELIGLEMETWDSEGGDGSRNNKRYF
eukprot:105615_1